MNTEIKKKLVALEANVDAVLFRRMYEEEERGGALKAGLGAAALTGAGYGAYRADKAIMGNYGGGASGPGVRASAYRAAANDAGQTAGVGYEAGKKAWQRSGGKNAGLFSRARRVLGGATRAMTGGRFGFEEIEGRLNRLIELADREKSYVGGAAGGAAKGAVASGVVGALGGAGLAALGMRVGGLRSPTVQSVLRRVRRTGVEKEALRRVLPPGVIATGAGAYGAKAAKYGALVGGGIGIGSARRRKQEQG